MESIRRRVDRLEELSAFAEQRHEELHGAMLDLSARLERALDRLAHMDARIRAVPVVPGEGRISPPDAAAPLPDTPG